MLTNFDHLRSMLNRGTLRDCVFSSPELQQQALSAVGPQLADFIRSPSLRPSPNPNPVASTSPSPSVQDVLRKAQQTAQQLLAFRPHLAAECEAAVQAACATLQSCISDLGLQPPPEGELPLGVLGPPRAGAKAMASGSARAPQAPGSASSSGGQEGGAAGQSGGGASTSLSDQIAQAQLRGAAEAELGVLLLQARGLSARSAGGLKVDARLRSPEFQLLALRIVLGALGHHAARSGVAGAGRLVAAARRAAAQAPGGHPVAGLYPRLSKVLGRVCADHATQVRAPSHHA